MFPSDDVIMGCSPFHPQISAFLRGIAWASLWIASPLFIQQLVKTHTFSTKTHTQRKISFWFDILEDFSRYCALCGPSKFVSRHDDVTWEHFLQYWPLFRGINRLDSPHKEPVMFKAFPCHDVIMNIHNTIPLICQPEASIPLHLPVIRSYEPVPVVAC